MKTLFSIVATLLVLAISGCAPQVDVEAESVAIRDAMVEWVEAENAKDVERMLSFFTDDASLLPPGAPMATGKEAIRGLLSQSIAIPGLTLSAQTTKVEVCGSGDLAYSLGLYEATVNDPQGKPITHDGKFVVVWRKQPDGSWKVVADISNSRLPSLPVLRGLTLN